MLREQFSTEVIWSWYVSCMNLKIFKFWFCRIVKRLILYIILSVFITTLSMVQIRPLWILWKNSFWKLKSENSNTSEISQDQIVFCHLDISEIVVRRQLILLFMKIWNSKRKTRIEETVQSTFQSVSKM